MYLAIEYPSSVALYLSGDVLLLPGITGLLHDSCAGMLQAGAEAPFIEGILPGERRRVVSAVSR